MVTELLFVVVAVVACRHARRYRRWSLSWSTLAEMRTMSTENEANLVIEQENRPKEARGTCEGLRVDE